MERTKNAKKLDNLPPSDDKYWDLSEVEVTKIVEKPKCEHEFIHKTSVEVVCRKCGVGYFLSIGLRIKGGHIYSEEKLII